MPCPHVAPLVMSAASAVIRPAELEDLLRRKCPREAAEYSDKS